MDDLVQNNALQACDSFNLNSGHLWTFVDVGNHRSKYLSSSVGEGNT